MISYSYAVHQVANVIYMLVVFINVHLNASLNLDH